MSISMFLHAEDPHFIVTESGLKYADTKNADGPIVQQGQWIVLNYRMALSMDRLQNNDFVDEYEDDEEDKEPIIIRVGMGDVLKGVDEGLIGMKIGATRRLIIPSHLAFGSRGVPSIIDKNSTLYVDITVTTKTLSLPDSIK